MPTDRQPEPRKGRRRFTPVPVRPIANRVEVSFSCRFTFDEMTRHLSPQQMQATMRGIAQVLAAKGSNHEPA